MAPFDILSWALLCLFEVASAQTMPNPARCVAGSGVTAFSACEYAYSYFSSCSAFAAESSAYQYFNCYCQQSYLNALFDCDSEERLCLGNGDPVDSHLSQQVSIWHSGCDNKISYTPTTPIISSITASYSTDNCISAQSACASLTEERALCSASYQTGPAASLTACICQPPVLTLAYDCSVVGNVSCVQDPAALTNMAEAQYCSNLDAVLTIPPSVTASLGTGTTIRNTLYTPSSTSVAAAMPTSAVSSAVPASRVTDPGSAQTASASPTSDGVRASNDKLFGSWTLVLLCICLSVW